MTGFIPEITTTVNVVTDTSEFDNAISMMQSDEWMSQCFVELIDAVGKMKSDLDSMKDPVAEAFAESLSSHQGQIISMYHKQSGMMMNSVDVSQDGEGVYLVGNTATTVDGFPYPLAIEQGTKSHWIAPVTFKALHWTDSDGEHFSKGHMVSGITADPYVDDSIDLTWSVAEDIINPFLKNILD